MQRYVGTVVRGIRTPIIKENDDLASIVIDSLLKAQETEKFEFKDRDIIGITEAVVGIASGNYVSVEDIACDLRNKFNNSKHIGIVFPILSRNRFSMILKAIARSTSKVTILLSYPQDEVGNHLFDEQLLDKYGINPYSDVLDLTTYNKYFKGMTHPFTGVNYVDFYKNIVENENAEVDFVFANNPKEILNYTKDVLVCDIHTRFKTKNNLKDGANIILGLDDIMTEPIGESGFNKTYGLLGSNKSTEERLKLFPTNGDILVTTIKAKLKELTGKDIEVMIYGDGAFKDPVGKIWELADPVVSPAYTKGLEGTPNEIKLKYISDNKLANLRGKELEEAMISEIKNKEKDLKGTNKSLGTTPRRLTDLIGSLCDLTSGSGDKGTPVVYIQGYFDNYAD